MSSYKRSKSSKAPASSQQDPDQGVQWVYEDGSYYSFEPQQGQHQQGQHQQGHHEHGQHRHGQHHQSQHRVRGQHHHGQHHHDGQHQQAQTRHLIQQNYTEEVHRRQRHTQQQQQRIQPEGRTETIYTWTCSACGTANNPISDDYCDCYHRRCSKCTLEKTKAYTN